MAGIYIHIPFCKKACNYCDFHFSTSLRTKGPVLAAMRKELSTRIGELGPWSVSTRNTRALTGGSDVRKGTTFRITLWD